MNLLEFRNSWRKEYESGERPIWPPYEEYIKNRDSEMWRSSSVAERFYEYVMWLESRVKEKGQ